ncbi:MAG: carbohydrate binding domain-containing protein [Bryobacteraceae bacterium]
MTQVDRRQRPGMAAPPGRSGRARPSLLQGSCCRRRRREKRASRYAAILFAAACAGGAAHAATPVALTNPGMEEPYYAVNLNGGAISGYLANGWTENSAWANTTVQYSEENTNPHSGSACQKVVVTSVGTGRVQFIQPFRLEAGNIYTASVWLRGDPGLQASLVIQQGVSPYATYIQGSLALTADWQQLIATGYITVNQPAYLMVAIDAPGTVWVDDFALSFAPGTFAPTPRSGPIPTTFFGMHVENFLQSQLLNSGFEPPYVSAGVNNPISGNIAVDWSDNSSWGVPNPTVTYSEDDTNPHGGTASQKVSVQTVPAGDAVQLVQPITVIPGQAYTLTAWLRGDPGMNVNLILQDANTPYTHYGGQTQATLTADWQQFSVQGVVNDTGSILLMFQASQAGTFWVDDVQFTDASGSPVSGGVPWPPDKFGTLRLWDTGTAWTSLEPLKGVWNWQPLDTWVTAAEQHGVPDILLTLGQTPPWASSNPSDVNYVGAGAPAPPTDNQDWRDYITAVAQRYKGRIRYYEIWNEPNDPTYYTGSVDELVELTKEAYGILKQVDPGNTVLSPAAYATGYLEQLLQAGMAPYVDMIAYHFYETPPEAAATDIANVNLVMAANGLSAMPVWATEGATGDNTTAPEDLAAAYLVRKYLVHLAFGSIRFDWYAWGKATTFCVGTEENDPRVLTEAGRAFGILLNWLHGAWLTSASIDTLGTWQIGLDLPGGNRGLIVWNPNTTVSFAIPGTFHSVSQHDIFGNVTAVEGSTVTIGYSPVLLISHQQRWR